MSAAARLCVRCKQPLGEGLFCQFDGTYVLDPEGTVVMAGRGERLLALLDGFGDDHLAHRRDAFAAEEHVFRATQPDSLRTERARLCRVLGPVRVRPHAERTDLIRPFHQLFISGILPWISG